MIGQRLAELLAMRAVAGLSPQEARELEELLAQYPEVDEGDFDLVAGSLPASALPAALRERLLQRASRESARRPWPYRLQCAAARALAALGFHARPRKW